MVNITQQLVTSTNRVSKGTNPCTSITIHETANLAFRADAQAHANLQSKGNVRQASWHYSVDDMGAIQSFRDDQRCWHAGKAAGNNTSIGVELCVNVDDDFAAAVQNLVELVQHLMAKHGISLSNVVQHNHWTGKNCPTFLRNGSRGITWDDFIARVAGGVAPPQPKPPTPTTPQEDPTMAQLPDLDWTYQVTQYDPMTERIQALLKADDCYSGLLDGKRGPISVAGLAKHQVKYNTGDGKGNADKKIGDWTWGSLLLGIRR